MSKQQRHQIRVLTILIAFLLLGLGVQAQDTLKLMQYNLTNYGNTNIPGCTAAINGPAVKDPYLTTILNYIKPDILGVNEMSRFEATATRITNILNSFGYGVFGRDRLLNNTGSDIVNTLYYNTNKLALKSHTAINANVRTIDHFKLYYKAADLATNPDTAFINIIIAHLKAGNTSSDSSSRRLMADAVVNYLTLNKVRGNVIMQGDFNCYNASEPAMTRLMARNTWGPSRFADPLNALGAWNNNGFFAQYHTQSSVVTGNGCLSSGGLDDRFDIFLANQHLLQDSNGVNIVTGTYKAIGNNGRVFNNTVNVAGNNSAPTAVLNALVNFSDHLPITLDLRINRPVITTLSATKSTFEANLLYLPNTHQVKVKVLQDGELKLQLINGAGQVVDQITITTTNNEALFNLSPLPKGVYMARLISATRLIKPTKLLIW